LLTIAGTTDGTPPAAQAGMTVVPRPGSPRAPRRTPTTRGRASTYAAAPIVWSLGEDALSLHHRRVGRVGRQV